MTSDTGVHKPVLLKETLELLNVQSGGRYIDCTLGTGGHARAIWEKCSPGGSLLGIDADPDALNIARNRLPDESVILVNDNFSNLRQICQRYQFYPVQGILFDLGLSSLQIDINSRGFSFQQDAPLDMRFSPGQELTAADIINGYPEKQLAEVIFKYGEERLSRQIAHNIVQKRPLKTTLELTSLIIEVYGGYRGRINPATRTFQALRIAVNNELINIEKALPQAVDLLSKGGRLVVISYHSLEDRLVKNFIRNESQTCICPPKTPACICNHKPSLKILTKRAVIPETAEISSNPRSRSAKMRGSERL